MLISLFEDIAEDIFPEWFVPAYQRLQLGDQLSEEFLKSLISNWRHKADMLRTSAEKILFLTYCRTSLLARLDAHKHYYGPPDRQPQLLRAITSQLQGDETTAKRFMRMVARSSQHIEMYDRHPPPADAVYQLVHFRGDSLGAPGMPVPGIQRMRIPPNGWLPDVLNQMRQLETQFKTELHRDIPEHVRYETLSKVPSQYIVASKSQSEGAQLLLEYDEGDKKYGWFNLNASSNNDEARSMGHCANTSAIGAVLYSFRSIVNLFIMDKGEYVTFHRPHLTAAINPNSKMCYELRGRGNSIPKEMYHPYIVDLVVKGLVTRFLYSSYENPNQFKIHQLSDEMKDVVLQHIPDAEDGSIRDTVTWKFFNGNGVIPEQEWKDAVREIHRLVSANLGYRNFQVEPNDVTRLYFKTDLTWLEVIEALLNYQYGFAERMNGVHNRKTEEISIEPLMSILRQHPAFISNYREFEKEKDDIFKRACKILVEYGKLHPAKEEEIAFSVAPSTNYIARAHFNAFYKQYFETPYVRISEFFDDNLGRISTDQSDYGYYLYTENIDDLTNKVTLIVDLDSQWDATTDGRDGDELIEEYQGLYWVGQGCDLDYAENLEFGSTYVDERKFFGLLKDAADAGTMSTGLQEFRDYFMSGTDHTLWIKEVLK